MDSSFFHLRFANINVKVSRPTDNIIVATAELAMKLQRSANRLELNIKIRQEILMVTR